MRPIAIASVFLVALAVMVLEGSPAVAMNPQEVGKRGKIVPQMTSLPVKTGKDSLPGSITVEKTTDPRHDPQVFDFTLAGGPNQIFRAFQLRDDAGSYHSEPVCDGSYIITEIEVSGWSLTDIILVDPDGESHCGPETTSVTIDVDPGEDIVVIFKNAKQ